ncbi:MAG: helix-turn-helix transcriptional regulator [Ruminococcus sp.]|nr:helix-turn-helix transcriptional regulator [Ruminococcus sp.]
MNNNNTTQLTLGAKVKNARKAAGFTQEQLAEKLGVSRQAITKWEADKGLPDIENIKLLSKALDVSIDYLLDDENELDMSVMREPVSLGDYDYKPSFSGRWIKKVGKKDMVVKEKYPDCEIRMLMAQQINTKSEKIVDNLIGFLTDAPFGIPEFISGCKNADNEYYLVNKGDKQLLVMVTEEFIESRQLSQKITGKKFVIGQLRFTDCGVLK